MYKLPILKSQQESHMRISSTGKVFMAGGNKTPTLDYQEDTEENTAFPDDYEKQKIKKNPEQYRQYFDMDKINNIIYQNLDEKDADKLDGQEKFELALDLLENKPKEYADFLEYAIENYLEKQG